MIRAHLVLIALCFTSLTLTQKADAASDANALWQAVEAKELAQEMGAVAPSQGFKTALLDRARGEDREYVKGMIIGWKKNKAAEVRTEFNILILRDASGLEALRMSPVQNEPGKFLINGITWTLPHNGSISQSLKSALAKKSAARNSESLLFSLISFGEFVHAAERTHVVDAAYLYSSLLHSKSSAGKNLWASLTRQPVEVQCSLDRASGRVKLGKHVLKFTAAKDGSVILAAFSPDPGTPFRVKNENGALGYAACLDANCDETSGPTKNSIKSFLKIPRPEDVDIADTFRPRDSHDGKYPIEFACEDESDCDYMEISGLEKMSARDKEWAIKYRDRANASLVKAKADTGQIIRSLEPLAACCQETACSQAVALNKINLVPSETIRSARTNK